MISNAAYLKDIFDQTMALGDKAISSDFTVVIEGHEGVSVLFKQFPTPILSSKGEIEVPGPMGTITFQPQQVGTGLQGPVAMHETKKSHVRKMNDAILANGGRFNARVYEGTPENNTGSYRIKKAFFVWDQPDRDSENRTQVVTLSGTVFYHYHGEE